MNPERADGGKEIGNKTCFDVLPLVRYDWAPPPHVRQKYGFMRTLKKQKKNLYAYQKIQNGQKYMLFYIKE